MISEKIGTVRQWGNLNYDQALTRKHDAEMFENLEFRVNSIDFFFLFQILDTLLSAFRMTFESYTQYFKFLICDHWRNCPCISHE